MKNEKLSLFFVFLYWYGQWILFIFLGIDSVEETIITLHWSSGKEFSCLKVIDFALEASLKCWPIYMKSIPVPAHIIKYLTNIVEIDVICHDSSLNRRRMKIYYIFEKEILWRKTKSCWITYRITYRYWK